MLARRMPATTRASYLIWLRRSTSLSCSQLPVRPASYPGLSMNSTTLCQGCSCIPQGCRSVPRLSDFAWLSKLAHGDVSLCYTLKFIFVVEPRITRHPADVVEDEGGDVTFHCEFEGSPLYSMVQWIKDGIPVRGPRHMVENTSTGSLRINSVLPSDQGAYVCQVLTMPYQPALSKPALLTVIEKLKFVPRPMNTNLELDAVRKVHCRAQGAAPPVIKWIKVGGSRAIHDTFNQLENGSLLIDYVQASDEGKYGCTAGNSGGLKRYEVTLIVRGTESYRVSDGNDVNSTLGGGMMSKTVAVTLGAAVAYMILVIGLMAYCRCRNKKNKSPPSDVQDPVCEYDQIQKR
ncbi:unnamed protein product [Nesidiocoris tenuis]|uniref:Ig-like domain-containing protein n=1 Tax=Nesidiocoris tenuis TaxID=355587 RepID=A0A6H5GUE9_9HEMI|nr:unnamed protein product [Nesidiocoris tenuis]